MFDELFPTVAYLMGLAFPPKLGRIKDLSYTRDYHSRTNRKGVEPNPRYSVGARIVPGSVQQRRVLLMPSRSSWPE